MFSRGYWAMARKGPQAQEQQPGITVPLPQARRLPVIILFFQINRIVKKTK
jgi:hypothetical protein